MAEPQSNQWSGKALSLKSQTTNKFVDYYSALVESEKLLSANNNGYGRALIPATEQVEKLYCRQGLVSPVFTIKRLAKKYHALDFTRFSQGGYIGDVPFGKGGICASLVMKWFSSLSQNISFLKDIGPYYAELKKPVADGREEVFQLAINYYTDIYAGDPGKADGSWNEKSAPNKNVLADYLNDYGIVDNGFLLREDQLDVDKLAQSLSLPGYYDIGIFMTEGGGHALDVTIKTTESDKHEYRLFDPNYGELVFDDQQVLQDAVKEYITRIYPNHIGKYRVQHFN